MQAFSTVIIRQAIQLPALTYKAAHKNANNIPQMEHHLTPNKVRLLPPYFLRSINATAENGDATAAMPRTKMAMHFW